MAVTNNVLNAINVFSSTSVFNSNKGSVGANDLNFIKQTTAELATEGGGIIAQSLGTNGYVKFANGLILQWGLRLETEATFIKSFPIAFSSKCYCVCLGNINEHTGTVVAHVANSNKVTNTQIEFASNHKNYYASNYWLALGC